MTVVLNSKEGCKVIRGSLQTEVEDRYNRFVNRLKAEGGGIHGSQSHVMVQPNTINFLHTIFIFYWVPKDVDVTAL